MTFQIGECSCKGCQAACRQRPGMFRPEQIAPLAKAFGLTQQQLFDKHLVVDFWQGDPIVFFLAPRRVTDGGGDMSPADPRGTCHWLVDGLCSIHTLGKPEECQALGHVDGHYVTADRDAIIDAWRTQQQMVRRLYGKKLVAPEVSFMESISWMYGGPYGEERNE